MMVAEGVCAARRNTSPAFRTAAYATSALANNIPDIDPIYTWITKPRPLGSLLHHRGHTHTLPIAWLMGLLVAWAAIKWVERHREPFVQRERAWLVALGLFGATLHITMDFGNSYGVHPFWPLDAHWYYGDSIFIIEPLWLAIALPALALAIETRWFAWFLWVLLVALFALALSLPFITRGTVVAFVVLSVISAVAGRFGSARTRIGSAWVGVLGVALCFVIAGGLARATIREALAADYPQLRIVDLAITPMPGNPLCWNALAVGQRDKNYQVLSANVAPLPSLTDAHSCKYDSDTRPTAKVKRIPASENPKLQWHWSYTSELKTLRQLAKEDCHFRALLGFVRIPYVTTVDQTRSKIEQVAGDLRYDRSPTLDFSDMHLEPAADRAKQTCPTWLPPWSPPRADLIPFD